MATSAESSFFGENVVRLWETETGKPLVRHPGPEQAITHLVLSPDSRKVATASWHEAVHLWEANTGKMLHRWKVFGPLPFTPDGRTLICGSWTDGKIHFLDLTTLQETRHFMADSKGIDDLNLSRNGKTLATIGSDGLRLWDLATAQAIQDFGGKQPGSLLYLTLSPNAKLLATAHRRPDAVRLWDTATGKLVREHPEVLDTVGEIAFSPNGKILASAVMGRDRLIRLRDVATGKEIRQLKNGGAEMIAFSPDGRALISGSQRDNEVYHWEVATGRLRQKLSGHQGRIACVAFSPDGRLMASGSADASVLIWDATGQRRRLQPPAPPSAAELDKLWADLATDDAAIAYQAICTLRASPRQAVRLFEKHLTPVPRADAKEIAEALRNLASYQFAIRNQATKALEALGDSAEPALRKALAGTSSVEFRRRVDQLLDRLVGAEPLRHARALETLESAGDTDSRRLLAALSNGAPQARLTEEARASLDRLGPTPRKSK